MLDATIFNKGIPSFRFGWTIKTNLATFVDKNIYLGARVFATENITEKIVLTEVKKKLCKNVIVLFSLVLSFFSKL